MSLLFLPLNRLAFPHVRHTRVVNCPVCEGAVKINEITVPSLYELKEDVEQLKLDCDFTVDEKEPGFVLKWLHNGVQIYQWIPSNKQPFVLVSFN